jgi:hypothetical protein
MWMAYAPYADRNFLSSIKRDFHSRFWEMLLCTQLLTAGFEVVKTSCSGPEFYIMIGGRRFWFEAVSPRAGSGPDAVPEIDYGPSSAGKVPIEQVVLRISSALREKIAHYERGLKAGRILPEDGYLVCINLSQIPHAKFGTEPSYPKRALYGVGNLTLSIDTSSRKVIDQFNVYTPTIEKVSGALVPTSPFFEKTQTSCCAVLYSIMDFFNIDRFKGNDFALYHNLNASHQLPIEPFDMYDQFIPKPIDESNFFIHQITRRTA